MTAAGTKTLPISFSPGELMRLKAAVAAHARVIAYVQAAILDPDGYPERTSKEIKLRIGS